MKGAIRTVCCLALAVIISLGLPLRADAKGYSSSHHSYSSSSHSSSFGGSHSFSSGSHSFSSGTHTSSSGGSSTHNSFFGGGGGNTSFNSGGGKSYSSGSLWSDTSRHSYSSGKSYSSGSSAFSFDTAAARARKEMASKQDFTRFKDSQSRPPVAVTDTPRSGSDTYRARSSSSWGYYHTPIYVPTPDVFSTRRVRIYNVFNPYYTRPVVIYHDPYSSFFWWWLLDRSLDDRAWWAYNHRYDMDPARYQALLATDQQLEARVAQLEAQQTARDPNFTPAGLDRDLMYSDQYVTRAYQNRPTTLGLIAFWFIGIPTALAMSGLVIWLIWFKRWQTAT